MERDTFEIGQYITIDDRYSPVLTGDTRHFRFNNNTSLLDKYEYLRHKTPNYNLPSRIVGKGNSAGTGLSILFVVQNGFIFVVRDRSQYSRTLFVHHYVFCDWRADYLINKQDRHRKVVEYYNKP